MLSDTISQYHWPSLTRLVMTSSRRRKVQREVSECRVSCCRVLSAECWESCCRVLSAGSCRAGGLRPCAPVSLLALTDSSAMQSCKSAVSHSPSYRRSQLDLRASSLLLLTRPFYTGVERLARACTLALLYCCRPRAGARLPPGAITG